VVRNPRTEHGAKDALRIQAAAVAAQQAALTEEEIRLQQRGAGLERQEAQLAAHLEAKRRRLVQLRDQARQAHDAIQRQRSEHEQRAREVAAARAAVEDGRRQLGLERRRLLRLRARLKRRWHQHWAAERAAVRQRQQELHQQRLALERTGEQLRQQKGRLEQARLRFNGVHELGRRELGAARAAFRRQQEQWRAFLQRIEGEFQERAAALDQREAALVEAGRRLLLERQEWDHARLGLQEEAEGLENRITNHRRKVIEQEGEILRLGRARRQLLEPPAAGGGPAPSVPANGEPAPATVVLDDEARELQEEQWRQAAADLHLRMAALEQLSAELADQRLRLLEQCERLARTQQDWQQERHAAAAALDAAAHRLDEREQAVTAREQAAAASLAEACQREAELNYQRRYLESWQARLTTRAGVWQGERERYLADLQSKETAVERHTDALLALRRHWQERQEEVLEHLQTELAACENLRGDLTVARADWAARAEGLARERVVLAERAQMLERYWQARSGRRVSQAGDDHRVARFRRRIAAITAAAHAAWVQDREAVEAAADRLDERAAGVQREAGVVARQEADLTERRIDWEQECARAQHERGRLEHELESLRAQRQVYQVQLAELQDEVERLARLLYDVSEPTTHPLDQAA
jgi:chromosome segregation protein